MGTNIVRAYSAAKERHLLLKKYLAAFPTLEDAYAAWPRSLSSAKLRRAEKDVGLGITRFRSWLLHVQSVRGSAEDLQEYDSFNDDDEALTLLIISGASVVASTNSNAGSKELVEGFLATGLLQDEVSQSIEPSSIIPIAMFPQIKRVVIAEDKHQLPAVVKADNVASYQMRCSMLERM